jgi:hypothetical protein
MWFDGFLCAFPRRGVAATVYCDYNPPEMKKLLFVLMLLCFAVQMSWAALDAYCQDGQELSVQVCADCAQEAQIAADKNGNLMSSALDCSNCGLHGGAILAAEIHFATPSSPMVFRADNSRIHLSSVIERPERPRWPLSRA